MRLRRTVAGAALTTVSATLLAALPLTAAQAVSADLVISQVYGGGGNSGATYTHDFIEIYNRGTLPVPLDGLSLQYAGATGAFGTGISELPDVELAPGAHFLVQEAAGTGGTTGLPTPVHVDDTPIAMSSTSGKVVLARGTASLACSGAGDCPADRVVDLVGYGAATWFEGAAATAAPSNTTGVLRKDAGAVDTDQNREDFVVGAPTPRNSGNPVPPPPPAPVEATIAEVQGSGPTSPLDGELVTVEGVVTGDSRGPASTAATSSRA